MAGLLLGVDLLQAGAGTASKSLHSFSSFSALSAALSASVGITFLPSYPAFSPQFEPWDWAGACAVCDAGEEGGETWAEEDARWLPQLEVKAVGVPVEKAYVVELKPLFSAFRPRALGATTLRACLVNFLPLLESYIQPEEDDLEEDADRPASVPVDAIVPLTRSATHILREVAVITTRRILERATVMYASPRIAWKLLKDVPKSAVRKSARITSKWHLFLSVEQTAFRGHALGVIANWVVQLVLDTYRYVRASVSKRQVEGKKQGKQGLQDPNRDFQRLLRKTAGNSLKAGASLVLASIGAGVGTVLIKPSIGTWIGCAAGDLAGPYLVGVWLDAWIFYGTFSPPSQDP